MAVSLSQGQAISLMALAMLCLIDDDAASVGDGGYVGEFAPLNFRELYCNLCASFSIVLLSFSSFAPFLLSGI